MWVLALHYLPYLSQEFRDTVNYFRKEMTGKLLLLVSLITGHLLLVTPFRWLHMYLRNMCSCSAGPEGLVLHVFTPLYNTPFMAFLTEHCDNGCLLVCKLQAVCSCISLLVGRICGRKMWKWIIVWFGDAGLLCHKGPTLHYSRLVLEH
jgi:hypothetical protein